MNKLSTVISLLIKGATLIVLIGVAFLIGVSTWAALQWGKLPATIQTATAGIPDTLKALNGQVAQVGPVLTRLNGVMDGINTTLMDVHRPCEEYNRISNPYHSIYFSNDSVMPCGFLASTERTLATLRLTSGAILVAANHEDNNLGVLDKQEATLFDDTHTVMGKLSTTLDTTNISIEGLQPVEKSVTDFINAPALKQTIANVDTTTGQFALVSTDFETKFHALLYPPKCVGWKCKIGDIYNGVRLGSQLLEPAFYARELFTGQTVNGTITVKAAVPDPKKQQK